VPESIARLFIGVAGVYLAAGTLFALPFVLKLAGRLDPAARAGSWGFRIIILPGVILLWPVLLTRLLVRR
jgi:hypothetical protein